MEQIVEVVVARVRDWVLGLAKTLDHFLRMVFVVLATVLKLAHEIHEEILVVDFVACQEAEHVKLLRLSVELEKVGVEGNQSVDCIHPAGVHVQEVGQGSDVDDAGNSSGLEHPVTDLSVEEYILRGAIVTFLRRVHHHSQGGQGVPFLELKAAPGDAIYNLLRQLVLQHEVAGHVDAFGQVEGTQELVVVERQDVVGDVLMLTLRVSIFQNSIRVELRPRHATPEEMSPLLSDVKWVKLVMQLVSLDALQKHFHHAAFEIVVETDTVLDHARVDLGCVSGGLRRVIFKVRDLIVMAEDAELFQERDVLDIDLRVVFQLSCAFLPLFVVSRSERRGLSRHEVVFIFALGRFRGHIVARLR